MITEKKAKALEKEAKEVDRSVQAATTLVKKTLASSEPEKVFAEPSKGVNPLVGGKKFLLFNSSS